MKKIKRDTTKDLFMAVLELVKKNGHYEKAEAIMDYILPNQKEDNIREDIELTNYRFNFNAAVQFGGSEGIYIDCFLDGEYTETELKQYNVGKGIVETEHKRHIGTFKTLKKDINSMKIMGELCGVLIFYADRYVNKNLDRYTPAKELEWENRYKNCHSARSKYICKLVDDMASINNSENCETCAGKNCAGKQDGCRNGIKQFIVKETNKYYSLHKYNEDERNKYYDFLDGEYNAEKDYFEEYINILKSKFPDITIYQAAGYVFTWLCTRKQNFIFYLVNEEKILNENGRLEKSYSDLSDYEKKQAFKLIKTQLIKEYAENDSDIDDIMNISSDTIIYYAEDCVYFYENGRFAFEY